MPEINPSSNPAPGNNSSSKPSFKKILIIVFLLFLFYLIPSLLVFLYKSSKQKPPSKKTSPPTPTKSVSLTKNQFAKYQEIKVDITPQVEPYKVNNDLSNVINKKDFTFSFQEQNLLSQNAFVVVPGYDREFFSLYEMNRYAQTPNFITTDSILHNYHLFFNFLLRNIEKNKLIPYLKTLNSLMLENSKKQYNQLKKTTWENAAKRNVAFFSVATKLLDPQAKTPSFVSSLVEKELTLIKNHQGIFESPVINLNNNSQFNIDSLQNPLSPAAFKEDYSQYIPRGHYTKTENLKNYFKSMMWYGRLSFRIKKEDEVKSAVLITLLLSDPKIKSIWDDIYQTTSFFVGKSDDISYFDFLPLLKETYQTLPTLDDLITQEPKFLIFLSKAKKLSPPKINSIPVFQSSINPDLEEEIKAFRFMGQRFTIDASIFQQLVCRNVGNKHGTMECGGTIPDSRMLPKSLDIPAAFGSKQALDILTTLKETEYEKYSENMGKLISYTSDLPLKTWTQNLYWTWLYSLNPLTKEVKKGYPSFMTNTAWARKDLNTYLGSWTELKHDTILYAKQVYAELGGGPTKEKDDRGYVEPRPYLYARLASLIKITKQGLSQRNLISKKDLQSLEKMEQLVISLKTISEKELNNKPLSDKDYDLIRTYGGSLEHFWLEAMRNEGIDSPRQAIEHPAALVVDVATDPNGQVLEEATGYINQIYVVFPLQGKLKIAKGAVFSCYEFTWPMSDRLTDEKWHQILDSDEKPSLPAWTKAFTTLQKSD